MGIQNFTLWVETDPNGRLTQTRTRSTFTNLQGSEDAWLTDDRGANFFSGNFTHDFTFRITGFTDVSYGAQVISLTKVEDEGRAIFDAAGDALWVQAWRTGGGAFTLFLTEINAGVETADSFVYALNTTYYCRWNRDETIGANGTLILEIYSDAAKTVLVDTLSVTLNAKHDFRYIMCPQSYNIANGNNLSGWIENVNLNPLARPISGVDVIGRMVW